MNKKLLSLFLAIVLLFDMATAVQANIQIQEDSVTINEVYYVSGQDTITGESIIRPTMSVSWKDPSSWADNPDPTLIHTPDYDEITADNLTRDTTTSFKINKGTTEFTSYAVNMEDHINLDTGSLYDIQVEPFHYHLNADSTAYELALSSGIPAHAYAITDLNVDFETTESSMQVIWDDLGVSDFNYRIVYAIGDYTNKSKQELINNKEGEIDSLTADSSDVTKFYDTTSKRNKLSYTITENIYPGQVYSVMVEPMVDYYNSLPVMRNRNYPVIKSCSTNVQLDVYEEGDYLRLEWDIPGSFKVGQNKDEYELVEATLLQYKDGQSSNVVIFNGNAAVIGYYKVPKPSNETDYQIEFVYKAVTDQTMPSIEPVSNKATYVPSDLLITPTRPEVPELFSQSIMDDLKAGHTTEEIRQILEDNYFVPGYTYTGALNTLLSQNNTYHVTTSDDSINFIWGAFKRIDVDPDSSTYNDYIYDSNVYYDIWVSDSLESLAYSTKVVSDQKYGSGTPNSNITDGTNIYGYSKNLNKYYNEDSGDLEAITPGKLYYIKIVAKKKAGSDELTSEPTIVSLYYGYDGDAYAPPTIAKPPLAVKDFETTDVGVTITWKESWWEVISADPDSTDALSTWRNEIWVSPDGTVSTENVSGATYFPVYEGQDVIDELSDYLASVGYPSEIISRKVDLGADAYGASDVKYKFYKIPYADVLSTIATKQESDDTYDFTSFYEDLVQGDKKGTSPINWTDISPTTDTDDITMLDYREEGLLPNTTYLFIVYPYRQLYSGDVLYAHYPTPIVIATNPSEVVVNPDPTVPNLYVSGYTDTNITVTWKYNLDFDYELVYSTFEDISTAKAVDWALPSSETDADYPVDGEYYEVTVSDLFPDTEYYFWIRASQSATGTVSHWSNAVMGKTRNVEAPNPPKGFGIASLESMKIYGYDASVTDNYLTVEWVLDENDVTPDSTQTVQKAYSYVLEVSNNVKFIDPTVIVSTGGTNNVAPSSVELLKKNIVKINDLVPNRSYYLRVKTRLTVSSSGEDDIVKDSSYSLKIKIITVSIGDEYDGIIDPELQILPSENYELVYNPYNNILEYRFRSNETDSDGANDNNVDQRLISSLIKNNSYVYDIDVSSYNNEQIDKRIISIPYSIIEAFSTYKVNMVIHANHLNLTIPYDAITSKVKEQVNRFGVAPQVKIQIETLDDNYLKNQMPDKNIRPVAAALDVGISVKSDELYQAVNYTDKPLEIGLLVNDKYEQFRINRIGIVKDAKSNWSEQPSSFDGNSGIMTFSTAKVGVYSGYVYDNSQITSDNGHWSQSYRKAVVLNYTIQGLNNYNPNNKVTEAQLINTIYPLVQGETNINLNASISKDEMNDLNYSKIKTNNSSGKASISREEAISMFVRSYEIMNGKSITPTADAVNAAKNNGTIDATYKTAMAKAATIGLVSQISNSRPKDSLTFGELFALWSKI